MNEKVIVIGGGLGGLAGAIRLAKMGYQVDFYEKNTNPGGKMNEWTDGNYRFDTGPSLVTMPFIIDDLFAFAGFERREHLEFVPIDPICRYFFSDGTRFDASSNLDAMQREINRISPDDVDGFQRFLDYAKTIYDITADVFILESVHEWSRLANGKTLRKLLRIGQIDAFRTVHQAVKHFFKDDRLVQIFDRYPTYNGSNPFKAPATLNTIVWVEYGLGGFYIKGGLYRLVEALVRVAEDLGVIIHSSTPVEKIKITNQKVSGIESREQFFPADAILCNVDVVETYNTLIDNQEKRREQLNKLEPSISGLVFCWGIEGQFDQLAHHNIFFSDDYQQEFESIFDELQHPDDPTIYIAVTSKHDKDHAPPNHENWFVLCNMPYLTETQNWTKIVEQMRYRIFKKLQYHDIDVQDKIKVEKVYTPIDFHNTYASNRGSIYGISSNDRNMAFRRPANRDRNIKGLYFAGGSSHPGGGVPLVLQSGKIAAELLGEHLQK